MLLSRTGLLRVVMRLMMDRRVPIRAKVAVPLALVYLVWPFDIVPIYIPFYGLIDDIIVITLATAWFLGTAPRNVVWEHIRGRPSPDSNGPDNNTIDADYRIVDDDGIDDEDKDKDKDK